MGFWILILLGIVQGLTEFLPVSSSGHLVVLYNIFGIEDNTLLVSILFHLATLLAVVLYYHKDIWILIRHPFCPTMRKLLVTTIFTAIIYVAISPIVDYAFGGSTIFIFFIITAIILFVSDYVANRKKSNNIFLEPTDKESYEKHIINLPLSYKQAIIIGVSQGLAVIPGISRSGTTIATSRLIGCNDISAKYSFLISIPVIVGSLLLEILKGGSLTGVNIGGLIVGFVVCFAVGLACIKLMVEFVKKSRLQYFSYYLLILSAFLILNDLVFHLF